MSAWPGEVAILFWLWLRHRDPAIRDLAGRTIADLTDRVKPSLSVASTEDILRKEAGTVLDPFGLTEEERTAAVAFTRIALSAGSGSGGVRIVPSSTIGYSGGMVIRPGPATEYFPRSILEGRIGAPKDLWWFAAREMPNEMPGLGARVYTSTSEIISSGYALLRLPAEVPGLNHLLPAYRQVLTSSTLSSESLWSLGIRLRTDQSGNLEFQAPTPEAMIRVTSALSQDSVVRIRAQGLGGIAGIVARVPYPPPEKGKRVPAVVLPEPTSGEDTQVWLSCDLRCPLPETLAMAALPHLPLPSDWPIPSEPEVLIEAIQSR